VCAPAKAWSEIAALEQRLAAHLDAVREGGAVALALAREALDSGEEARLMAGAYLLASFGDAPDGPAVVLHAMSEAAEDLLPHWVDALVLAEASRLAEHVAPLLSSPRPEVRAAAVHILGHRHEGQGAQLLPLLDDASPEVRGAAVLALARLGHREARPAIEHLLLQVPVLESEPLAFAALCLGSARALQHCRHACQSAEDVPAGLPRLLALAGDERDAPLLQRLCAHPSLAPRAIEALGILGAPSAVPCLLEGLAAEARELRLAAGTALNLLTGAALHVTTRVRDADDGEDDPGREVRFPCTDAGTWTQWWSAQRSRFGDKGRWRLGRPFTLATCLEELTDPRSAFPTRERAGHELRIRSGQPLGFEPDGPVHRQRLALARWQQKKLS